MKFILKISILCLMSAPAFSKNGWISECQLHEHGNGHGFVKTGEPTPPVASGGQGGNGSSGNSTTKEPKQG